MIKYVIYKATFPNGKIYIGMTKNLKQRKQDHKKKMQRGGKSKFYSAMIKYGYENIIWEIICNCDTFEEMCKKEEYYIEILKPEYNMTAGGIAPKMSDEIKSKMSQSTIGTTKTDEAKKNMKKARRKVLEDKGQKLKDKSPAEKFIERFNEGSLSEDTISNLKKLKEIDNGKMSLKELAEKIGVTECTIVRYQRMWLVEYNHTKTKERKKMVRTKDSINKGSKTVKLNTRRRNTQYLLILSNIDTNGKSVREISEISEIPKDIIQRLHRCWEDIIEEEGF